MYYKNIFKNLSKTLDMITVKFHVNPYRSPLTI